MAEYLSVQTVTKQTTSWCLDKHNVSSILPALSEKQCSSWARGLQEDYRPIGTLQAYWNITSQLEHYRPTKTLQASRAVFLVFSFPPFVQTGCRLYINLTELQGCALQPHFGNYPRQKQAKEWRRDIGGLHGCTEPPGIRAVCCVMLHASVRHCMPCQDGAVL